MCSLAVGFIKKKCLTIASHSKSYYFFSIYYILDPLFMFTFYHAIIIIIIIWCMHLKSIIIICKLNVYACLPWSLFELPYNYSQEVMAPTLPTTKKKRKENFSSRITILVINLDMLCWALLFVGTNSLIFFFTSYLHLQKCCLYCCFSLLLSVFFTHSNTQWAFWVWWNWNGPL